MRLNFWIAQKWLLLISLKPSNPMTHPRLQWQLERLHVLTVWPQLLKSQGFHARIFIAL